MNNPEHPASLAVILLSTLLRVGATVASFFFGSALLGAAWRRLMLGWRSGPTTIWLVSRRAQTAGRIALALYAAFLLGIAVWRPWTEPAAPFSGRWELVPFTGTADLWRAGLVPFVFLFVGNIACFVPFGFGLPALTPLRRAVVPICLLGSLLIEVLQWSLGTGVSQVEDILLNTLGAALGYALFRAVPPPVTRSPAALESHAEFAEPKPHAESAEGAEPESHAESAENAEF